jgi:Protein of unknown function DUF262
MVCEGSINVSPEYQRHFIWDKTRQSQLIESLFLGIPIPSLFMATNRDSTWEVVDGLQRLTTLLNFFFPPNAPASLELSRLELGGLEKLTALNGATFERLPAQIKLQLQTRPVRITVLNDLSDYQVRFDLFERLNTGGIALHEQEIRSCVFIGRFNDFIKKCASDPRLKVLVKRTDTAGRGNLEELVLKLFAFLENRDGFVHSVKEFLNNYMETKTRRFSNESELKRIFDGTLDVLIAALPNGIVRQERPNTTPLLLFEAVAVGVADLVKQNSPVNYAGLATAVNHDDLRKLTSGGTNSKPKLVGRIDFVRNAASV